ncbi:hypothetical protein B0J14DRAFT_653541 [Halenospora varia]|nr:hypothetical protein B0J14DRAFT_653541 [Halenospora varia]
MPGRELGSSDPPNGVHGVGTTLLKRHKTLPHPRENRVSEIYPSTPVAKPQELAIDTGISSISSSDTSSPRTLKHTSKRIGILPPTPPTHSRQSSGSHAISVGPPKFDVSSTKSSTTPTVPSTPPNQRSPPTPDVTPPRAMPLAFRPSATDRYPSSRADSFKTARENPYSSDEDEVSTVRPVLPSARPSAFEVPQLQEKAQKRKEVGLGLGLESDEGTTTPRPRAESPVEEFHVFDGEWGSESGEVEREWDYNLMRNVIVRKRPGQRLHMFTDGATDEVLEDDLVSPTAATRGVRSLPLQERIERHRKLRQEVEGTPVEKFAQRVPWPVDDSPTTPDVRRFSAMSGRSVTSTVVEAMVVDAPPIRRKTLRHTKKQIGLREFSSDQSTVSSAPTSVVSVEPHRLHHAKKRIPDKRHQSLASTGTLSTTKTISTTSSNGKSRRRVLKEGGIPVVIIPDRASSTKSSKAPSLRSTSSRRTKRSMSLNSAPLSHSSKFNEPGYFDTLPPRKRTMSESVGSGDSIRTIDYPPNIPARRSSLSAPTSRNTSRAGSRAGSLTTESLKAHNLIQAKKEDPPHPEPQPTRSHLSTESHKELRSHGSRPHVDHNGDPFFGKRYSTQVTPFSQVSYETAGTAAEVSEAQAVSIYPHQNTSLLVVQQKSSSSEPEQSPPGLKPLETSQPAPPCMTLTAKPGTSYEEIPVTPPQPAHRMDEVDSPLRNPRAPPEPPAIKFIPPTPAALTPGREEEKQLGYGFEDRPTSSDSKPTRGMSLMRRAFSKRRNSEPAMHIQPGFLKRTLSLSNRHKAVADKYNHPIKGTAEPSTIYPSVADQPADESKLHPFWRPTHFWDDLEGEGFADDELDGRYPIIDNRPALPQRSLSGKLKRTFAILPIKDEPHYQPYSADRRTMRKSSSGNLRVVKQRSNNSLSRDGSHRHQYSAVRPESSEGSFGYGFKDGNGGRRVHTIPGIGVRVEYVGWGGMKRKLSEKRREQRSEKLRQSISNPRAVHSGIDDVLRRRRSQI